MNPNKLKRLFPNASESFKKLNSDNAGDTGMSDRRQQTEARVGETLGDEKVDEQYCLRRVEIEFFAKHGKQFDEDNRRYSAKPIIDALVNLGFEWDDKNITSETTQRMDDNKTYF